MSEPVRHIFVYGTLMHGERNHPYYCGDALTIEPATTQGELYDLSAGFPAMVEAEDGIVHGESMTFPDLDATLAEMDILESYRPHAPERSLYLRRVQPITLTETGEIVLAYCYVWQGQIPSNAVRVQSGRWSRSSRH